MITLDLSILNQKGTPMFYSDTLAARPAFGIAGRIFIDIASPYGIYRDTGSAWQQIAVGSAGSGTITGGGTINTIAMFTPTGTDVGDSKISQSGSDITIDANVYVTNGNINLPANNTVGGTTYKIQQTTATNDGWSIYGNAFASDQGEVVFEVSDNGASFNPAGQRYRFHYEAVSSGSNKDVLILDYNLSSFTTAINVAHTHTGLAGATNPYGEQIAVTNTFNAGITWTALLACFNTSSLQTNNWNGSATFGNGSYTTNNLNLSSITFNAAGSTITNTQASGGARAWANQILQLRIDGTNNGTYTHYANSAVYGDYASSTARLIITNRYGYLVNDLDEYSAGHTYTNRWAFYNAGLNDNNYFAGKVGIGSGYTPGTLQLDVTGSARINGQFFITGSINAVSGFARGTYITSTVIATANNDTIAAVDISPTFNQGSFTGLTSACLRINAGGATARGIEQIGGNSSNFFQGTTYIGSTSGAGSSKLYVSGICGATTFQTDGGFATTLTSNLLNLWNGKAILTGNTNGGMSIHNSAEVDTTVGTNVLVSLNSTTRGLRLPRLTTVQKNAIATPVTGLLIYDTTLNKLCIYTTTWETITSL